MSLITGVSTADEFLEAINDKGASLTNESTAYDLATAIDATGGNVSWQSPNEVVVAAVNAEVPPEPPTTVTISLVKHLVSTESESRYFGFYFEKSDGESDVTPLELVPGTLLTQLYANLVGDSKTINIDTAKTKVTIGETSYTGSEISNIQDNPWLSSIYSFINTMMTSGSGAVIGHASYTFISADVVPDADVTIEVFEEGYTE